MTDAGQPLDVVFLAGRLARDEAGALRALAERLDRLGVGARVICLGVGEGDGTGFVECPGLGRWWQRAWSSRGLRLAGGSARPHLLHALRTDLDAAGLEIAERWQIPYLLTVEEFLPPGGRFRLSRAWCRGLV